MVSKGLAECEWNSGVLESAVYHDYEPLFHRRKSAPFLHEPTVTVMKADSHLQVDPSKGVCHRCQKRLRSPGAKVDWRSLQTDRAGVVCDTKMHANTEGEVQMESGRLSTP